MGRKEYTVENVAWAKKCLDSKSWDLPLIRDTLFSAFYSFASSTEQTAGHTVPRAAQLVIARRGSRSGAMTNKLANFLLNSYNKR